MSVNRREFLGASAAAASAAAFGVSWASRALAQNNAAQSTSDIRVAQIGFNGQGQGHIQHNHQNLVALCDVDEAVLHRTADKLKQRYGHKLETYTDFRKLLERKDVDAVSIATPNHIHALIAVAAAQAGKHVYVEKPASHNIWEGRQMIQAARQNNRIMQCGTQSRSSSSLKEAVAFVQGGELGKIQYALGTCYKPRPSIGKLDKPLEIPGTLDYDLWCGPAAKESLYRPKVHYDWHWDFNTGNGDMGNQGIHQMDIARWFLGEKTLAPRTISIGGRLGYEDAGNTPNTQIVFLDYPAAPLIFETRGLPRSLAAQKRWGDSMDRYRGSRIGVIVQCENGYVLVPSYVEAIAYDNAGHEIKHWNVAGDALGRHIHNFLGAVAANEPARLNADIQEGHLSSSLCHLGGISHQLGKTAPAGEISEQIKGDELLSISFDRMASHLRANGVDIDGSEGGVTLGPWLELDPATEQFVGNDAATELRSRKSQREPFAVPDLERNTVAKAG
jgi:predicted dehydrogenase